VNCALNVLWPDDHGTCLGSEGWGSNPKQESSCIATKDLTNIPQNFDQGMWALTNLSSFCRLFNLKIKALKNTWSEKNFIKQGHTNLSQMCQIKVPESSTYGRIWDEFVKILTAYSSRPFDHRKYFVKHKLKAHHWTSCTQRSLSLKKRELELQPCKMLTEQSGTYVKIWDKFVKSLTVNTSRTFRHKKYLIEHKLKAHHRTSCTQNFRFLSIKLGELKHYKNYEKNENYEAMC